MATLEKINNEIDKVKSKITELQKKLKVLEAQKAEEENLEIVKIVRAVNMDSHQLKEFIHNLKSGNSQN